jgi:hypothetical protein
MPLWGNNDDFANSVYSAVQQVNLPVDAANRENLYANTTGNVFVDRATVGQFGISAAEQQAARQNDLAKGAHAGWNLRTVGQGGRAGRVFYETLVAMGSMAGDGSDDTLLPDIVVRILNHPVADDKVTGNAVSFTVVADSVPAGGTLNYKWQRENANVADGGIYSNSTAATLTISNNATINGNSIFCSVWVNGIPASRVNTNAVIVNVL